MITQWPYPFRLRGGSRRAKDAPPKRVVILGGGFAGVATACALARRLGRRRDVQVELLSSENYFVFQPLLPEVAAGSINPNHVVNPIRDLLPRTQFRWCRIESVDSQRKVVLVTQGEGRDLIEVPYDHLVFALGKISDVSSMPGVAEHGLAMKDLGDAFRLRNHVLRCLELADVATEPAEKQALLTFVVAGGGFSGVETIGELSEMLHRCIGNFPKIAMSEIKLGLIHSRGLVLPEMSPALGQKAETILRKRGIEMIMDTRVRAATRHGVHLSSGAFLPTRTLVCTVGNTANPVVKNQLATGGFVEGRFRGRGIGVFETDLMLQCTGRPGHWALGDNAAIPDPEDPQSLCPPTAQFAIREADTCARNILATIDGKPLSAFHYRNLGMLASLGHRSGVAEVMGFRFSGFAAWLVWRAFYWASLPGIARKTRVLMDWALDLIFPRDIAQIQNVGRNRVRVDHYEAGEIIIRKHEIGRELFMIKQGEVEVYQPAEAGGRERIVTLLRRGEVFGEKAILQDTRRTASVRAKTAVDVLVLSRDDFKMLVEQFAVLGEYFHELMGRRYGSKAA
jgi:NADH dehydrogenase